MIVLSAFKFYWLGTTQYNISRSSYLSWNFNICATSAYFVSVYHNQILFLNHILIHLILVNFNIDIYYPICYLCNMYFDPIFEKYWIFFKFLIIALRFYPEGNKILLNVVIFHMYFKLSINGIQQFNVNKIYWRMSILYSKVHTFCLAILIVYANAKPEVNYNTLKLEYSLWNTYDEELHSKAVR